jgi:hypothetical protein
LVERSCWGCLSVSIHYSQPCKNRESATQQATPKSRTSAVQRIAHQDFTLGPRLKKFVIVFFHVFIRINIYIQQAHSVRRQNHLSKPNRPRPPNSPVQLCVPIPSIPSLACSFSPCFTHTHDWSLENPRILRSNLHARPLQSLGITSVGFMQTSAIAHHHPKRVPMLSPGCHPPDTVQ